MLDELPIRVRSRAQAPTDASAGWRWERCAKSGRDRFDWAEAAHKCRALIWLGQAVEAEGVDDREQVVIRWVARGQSAHREKGPET